MSYAAIDWPDVEDVTSTGFCRGCKSHFCPHAYPSLYGSRPRATTRPRSRFQDAANTLVLDGSHDQGIQRGARGQAFAAEALGVVQEKRDNSPFDFRAADGTRVDVKTTKPGMPLMIPRSHSYKVDPKRVDAFLLVYDGEPMTIVGQIGVMEFREKCSQGGGRFPIPTLWVEVEDLESVPVAWYA